MLKSPTIYHAVNAEMMVYMSCLSVCFVVLYIVYDIVYVIVYDIEYDIVYDIVVLPEGFYPENDGRQF
jgi:hypothetical protein